MDLSQSDTAATAATGASAASAAITSATKKAGRKPKSPVHPVSTFLSQILMDGYWNMMQAIVTLLVSLEMTQPMNFSGYTVGPDLSVFYAAMSGSITIINCISWLIFVLFRKDSVTTDNDRSNVHLFCESILPYIYANHHQSPELRRLLVILSTNLNEVDNVKKFPMWFTVSLWIICSVSSGENLPFPDWILTSTDCYKIWQFLPEDHRRQILRSQTLKKWMILSLRKCENPPHELVNFLRSSICSDNSIIRDVYELDLLNILCGIDAITRDEFVKRIFHDSTRIKRGRRLFFSIVITPVKLAAFWRKNLPSIFSNLKNPEKSDDLLFDDFFAPGWLSSNVDLTRVDAVDLRKYILLLHGSIHINSTGVFDENFFVRFTPEIQTLLFSTIIATNLVGVITLILYPGISRISEISRIGGGAPFNLALYRLVQDYMRNFASWPIHEKSYLPSSLRFVSIEFCFYIATDDFLTYLLKQYDKNETFVLNYVFEKDGGAFAFWIFLAKEFIENLDNLKKKQYLELKIEGKPDLARLKNVDLAKIDAITREPSFANMLFKMFGFPFFNIVFLPMKFSGAISLLIPIICEPHFVDSSEVLFLIQQMGLILANPTFENYSKLMLVFDEMNRMQLKPSGRFWDFLCKFVSQFAEKMSFRLLTTAQMHTFFEKVPICLRIPFFKVCKRLACFEPIEDQPIAKRSKTDAATKYIEARCSECSNSTRRMILCWQVDRPDILASIICTQCAFNHLKCRDEAMIPLLPTSLIVQSDD